MRLFFVLLSNFITQVEGKLCTNKKLNSTSSGIQHNFFYKNALTFWPHKYSKLFQFNFPETYLPNLCITGRLELLEDGFF